MGKSNYPEKNLYSIVREYLRKTRGCVTESYNSEGNLIVFENRGPRPLRVDVYGLKGIGNRRLRGLEGIAVEVKKKQSNTPRRYVMQTLQYSLLAHRCYLAQPADFTPKAKSEAASVGIGLLRIRGANVELVSESKLFTPDPGTFDSFLNGSLHISRCAICGCYQFRHGHPANGRDCGGSHRRCDHLAPGSPGKNKRTFLCPECEQHWASASEFNKLKRQVTKLQKQLTKLRRPIK